MIEPILQSQLEPIVQRHRRSRFWRAAALGCAILTPVFVLGILMCTGTTLAVFLTIFALVAVGAFVLAQRSSQSWEPDYREVARRIEHQHPDLHALLITAVEQQPEGKGGQLNFLQERVVRDANEQIRKLSWLDMATMRQMRNWKLATFGLLGVWLATLFLIRAPENASASVAGARKKEAVTVTPGDVNVEKGSSLVVLARFDGGLPKEATLVIRAPAATNDQRVYLTKNLGDPVFGGSVPEVLSNFTYRVEYDGKQTTEYKVRVYEHPRLEHADANINYPEYTKLAPKVVPETKRVSAVEGSKVDFTFKLNKPVVSAKLIGKDKSVIPLAVDTNQPVAMLKQFALMTNGTYNLELVDADGRTNKIPSQFAFNALKNRPPELKVITPKGDQRVSPLEEVAFQGEAWDDFGLGTYGLTYTVGGEKPKSIVLGEKSPAGEKRPFQQVLSLEEIGVKPDQLVSWYLWAEDIGPDGKPRRTSSDMYFVEVRPFEEIYRQGNSMEGQASQQQQQQGGANQALKLAELQKQIINATWKLQRQETGPTRSPTYGKDVPVVLESQENALEQAQALKEKTTDPRMQGLVEAVEQAMEKAVSHLGEATNSPTPLPSALASEQAAYQALLKIAGREYLVSQNKSRESSSSPSNQRNQEQLSQLDLKKEENRYETQRQAASQPQSEEQKEQLAMLNRLKELAQRQQDVNERIKELQNALQEAKTDAEKEEIRRRLKRLREEEQEMLADIDDLQHRMQQPQNQSQTADAQKQLEQTRSEVQKTSQALQNESASQALASGTRAQRNLQQMRDDLRKKSSSQFAEEMRQMRGQARELAQNQEEISKQMETSQEKDRKSLRDSGASEQLAQQLEKQKNSLTNLLENMRSVSEKSETSEPLLSKQLYDSFRKASQENVEEKLNVSEELVKRSMSKEAGQVEQLARQHIQDLKNGVEKAAQSVLGDDVESLKLAKSELDALSKELDQELAQSDAGSNQKPNGQAGQNRKQQNAPAGQGQKGQPQDPQGNPSGQQGQNGEQTLAQANGASQEQQPQEAKNASGSQNQQQPGQQGKQGAGQGQNEQKSQQASQQGQQQGEQSQPGQGQGQQQANSQDSQQKGQQGGQSQQPGQQQNQQGSQSQQQQAQANKGGQQGGQPQQQPSEQQNQQNQQGQGQGQGQGQNPQQVASNQQNQQPNGQKGEGQQGQRNNQNQNQNQNQKGQRGQGQGQGQEQAEQANGQPGQQQTQTARNQNQRASSAQTARNKGFQLDNIPMEGGPEGPVPQGPLTGENYVQWSERLGNVEEMVDVPELRTEIARIRERARNARSNFKKQGQKPDWAQVHTQISGPLNEVRSRIAEELARRESKDALVPIDRDPVPARYSDLVRRYYEKLGSNE